MIAIPRLQHIRRICIPAVWSQEKALHTLQVYHWQSCVKLSLIDFDQINAILKSSKPLRFYFMLKVYPNRFAIAYNNKAYALFSSLRLR